MNWERTRSLFPVTERVVYLNHAGVAPISSRVAEALHRYAHGASHQGGFAYAAFVDSEIERVRTRAATLLGAQADEIAFVKNTTEGLGLLARGLDWQRGDRIVTCDLEFPSNVYPWWALRPLGVETVMLRSPDGRLPFDRVAEAVRHPGTRLLTLSSVEYANGFRNDLVRLGALCRDHGVLFCVDGIQSLGCLGVDVEACGIDVLAAGGHKWLLSVEGCGLLFCARRLVERVTPVLVGWRSVREPWDYDRYQSELPPSARRFEEGTPNVGGLFALGAALDLLLELGIDRIEDRVLSLTDHLVARLRAAGAEIRSPRGDGEASGIVAFRLPGEAPEATARRLRDRRIFVVARRGAVRASPHFYNTSEELDELVGALG